MQIFAAHAVSILAGAALYAAVVATGWQF